MSDRGDYRSIYCAFWDDADVHTLSHLEYRVLTTLKGTLPASGIGVVYVSQLAERCAAPLEAVEAALSALEKGPGWVVRERNVAWIVNALRFEPTLTPTNPKHRTFLLRLLAPLGLDRPIVRRFQRYYPQWFPDAAPEPSPTYKEGNAEGSDRVSNHSPSLPGTFRSVPAPVVREESELDPKALLAAAANRGISERWGEQPSPIRWDHPATAEVLEMITTAKIPVDFARDAIYAAIPKLSLARPPRTLKYFSGIIQDAWIDRQAHADAKAVTPQSLPNGAKCRENRSAAEARERSDEVAKIGVEREYAKHRREAVAKWAAGHADEYDAIVAAASAEAGDNPFAKTAINVAVETQVAQLIGFQSFEDWSAQRRAS